jgi:hypothetical protein
MVAAEIAEGFGRLGIKHERTLPYSAWQNGKSENVWSSVEGRLRRSELASARPAFSFRVEDQTGFGSTA